MPLRLVVLIGGLGALAGAIFGFVRGLDYLPTLPVAIVEGAFLFGTPAGLVGCLAGGVWWLLSRLMNRRGARPGQR